MFTATVPYLSLGELGDTLGVQSWRIARLFELRIVPEPPRIGRRRLIPKAMVAEIVDALRARGWLAGDGADAQEKAGQDPEGVADAR